MKIKIRKILIIISILILIISIFVGISISTELLDTTFNSEKISIDDSDFTRIYQLFGFFGSKFLFLAIIIYSITIVGGIWLLYLVISLLILFIKKVKNKKILILFAVLILIFVMLFLGIHYFNQKSFSMESTVGSIAYNSNSKEFVLYIEESNNYIPYLVLHNNYNNTKNTLLLREHIIDNQLSMESYKYEDSDVDSYLTNSFIKMFDSKLVSKIANTKLNFSNILNNIDYNYTIERKFFILSNIEVGFSDTFDNNTENRMALKYFKDNTTRISTDDNNVTLPWWTRTYSNYSFCAVGYNGGSITQVSTYTKYGIRPAFTIPSDTKVKKIYSSTLNKDIYTFDI